MVPRLAQSALNECAVAPLTNLSSVYPSSGGNFKEMPQVTDPIALKTPAAAERGGGPAAAASMGDLNPDADLDDDESDVDIN